MKAKNTINQIVEILDLTEQEEYDKSQAYKKICKIISNYQENTIQELINEKNNKQDKPIIIEINGFFEYGTSSESLNYREDFLEDLKTNMQEFVDYQESIRVLKINSFKVK